MPSEIYPNNTPTSSKNTTKRYKPTPREWTHSSRLPGSSVPSFQETMSPTQMDHLNHIIKSPADSLKLFLSEELVGMIVNQSQVYAPQKQLDSHSVTPTNIQIMFAIMLLSGYAPVPDRRMYWRLKGDAFNSLVSNAIRRDSFEHLIRVIHFADNIKTDTKNSDPYYKIRDFYTIFNKANKVMALTKAHLLMRPWFHIMVNVEQSHSKEASEIWIHALVPLYI